MHKRYALDLVSHWRIEAPAERVWSALADVRAWSAWWPQVRAVQLLRIGDAQGLGGQHRVVWVTPLRLEFVTDLETVELLPAQRLRCRSSSPLPGEGIWLLRSASGSTELTGLWRVVLAGPWMRLLSPLIRSQHAGVMRAGEAGLARHLAALPRMAGQDGVQRR